MAQNEQQGAADTGQENRSNSKKIMREIYELESTKRFKEQQLERMRGALTPTQVNEMLHGNARLATIRKFSAHQARATVDDLGSESGQQMLRDISRLSLIREAVLRGARALATKLNEEIDRGHRFPAFSLALLLALAKDALDIGESTFLTMIQAIPVVGQVLSVILAPSLALVDIALATFLFFFMRHKGFFLQTKLKVMFWALTGLDLLPYVGAIPLQTLTVMWAYYKIQKRAVKAKLKLKKLERLTQKEIEGLNKNIELLDEKDS